MVVLRGVEPFSQLFVAASHERAQFEAFDELSGARVGTFSPDTEDELPGTKLCLGGRAVSDRPPGLPPSPGARPRCETARSRGRCR